MKIRPNANYQMTGTNIRLDSLKVYEAVSATNQPDWNEKGKVFCLLPDTEDSFLLEAGEYEIISA
jgi:hypothetical protein